jgi:DNA-binding GntR family transcriptional regulator
MTIVSADPTTVCNNNCMVYHNDGRVGAVEYTTAGQAGPTSGDSYATLKDHLLRGVIPPGVRLVERTLSLELGISRTPLRGALVQLESQRLVVRTEGGSWFVPVLTEREIRDIFTCRADLESLAAVMAVERASDKEVAALAEPTRRSEQAFERGDLIDMTDANSKFHLALYRATGSSWLISTIEPLRAQTTRMRFLIVGELVQSAYSETHQRVFDAVTRRDAVAAAAAARKHVMDDLAVVLRHVKVVQRQAADSQGSPSGSRRGANKAKPTLSG